jgi:hypothetical protein
VLGGISQYLCRINHICKVSQSLDLGERVLHQFGFKVEHPGHFWIQKGLEELLLGREIVDRGYIGKLMAPCREAVCVGMLSSLA